MSSIFTQIKEGSIPGHVVYEDDVCFVLLTVQPHNPGHILVVPNQEVADWQELEPTVWTHIMAKAQVFGKIIHQIYQPPKVGVAIVGFHVLHVHVHIFSLFKFDDINQDKAKPSTDTQLQVEAEKIKAALKEQKIA